MHILKCIYVSVFVNREMDQNTAFVWSPPSEDNKLALKQQILDYSIANYIIYCIVVMHVVHEMIAWGKCASSAQT